MSHTEYAPLRGIDRHTMQFFDIASLVSDEGITDQRYPYHTHDGKVVYKYRKVATKSFSWSPDKKGTKVKLFGQNKFDPGSGKFITITEGELDAASVFQMTGSKWPVVSVPSASEAGRCVKDNLDYLNSFDKVYLAFDNDAAGQKATEDVASILGYRKIHVVKMTAFKDANGYLTGDKEDEFRRILFNAPRYSPTKVVSDVEEFVAAICEEDNSTVVPYPWDGMNEKTYGIRSGEVVLITAQEGLGKTEVVRNIEYNIFSTTDHSIGVIHLEEPIKRVVQGYVGIKLGKPVFLPDCGVPLAEQEAVVREIMVDGKVQVYRHFGSDDVDDVVNTIRVMAKLLDCKYIFIDHISILVSDDTANQGKDERRLLDTMSTKLKMLAQELDVGIIVVSHVNDNGQTRGSRNIGKIADIRIDLYRDQIADDPIERNTTTMMVSKNSYCGKTGLGSKLFFDLDNYSLKEITEKTEMSVPTSSEILEAI